MFPFIPNLQHCTALSNDSIEKKDTQDADKSDGEKYKRAEHVAEVVDLMLDGEVAGHLKHIKFEIKLSQMCVLQDDMQSGVAYRSWGFEDEDLGSSPGLLGQ